MFLSRKRINKQYTFVAHKDLLIQEIVFTVVNTSGHQIKCLPKIDLFFLDKPHKPDIGIALLYGASVKTVMTYYCGYNTMGIILKRNQKLLFSARRQNTFCVTIVGKVI